MPGFIYSNKWMFLIAWIPVMIQKADYQNDVIREIEP